MARDQGVKTPAKGPAPKAVRPSAAKPAAVAPVASKAVAEPAPRKKTSPAQFWREVQVEARKTTWTPWRETWITSAMVAIMIVITAIFFSVVDGSLNFLMQQFLRFAAGG
jgi:preprotein translocase subunit SecE